MRLRAGDVFGVEALIEIDRGIDAAHDLRRAAGKAAAPQRIRRGVGPLLGAGHRLLLRGPRRGEIVKRAWAAAFMFLLAVSSVGSSAERDTDAPDRTKLGEFVPATNPLPAPAVSLFDLAGNSVGLNDFLGKVVLVNLWATWCEPCLHEMPSLERLQSRLGDRIA